MKKTGTIKNKVFAGVIAAVCAVSAISTGAIIGASAHSSASAPIIESRTSRKNPRGFESPDNTKKGSQRLSDFLFFSVPKGIRPKAAPLIAHAKGVRSFLLKTFHRNVFLTQKPSRVRIPR